MTVQPPQRVLRQMIGKGSAVMLMGGAFLTTLVFFAPTSHATDLYGFWQGQSDSEPAAHHCPDVRTLGLDAQAACV